MTRAPPWPVSLPSPKNSSSQKWIDLPLRRRGVPCTSIALADTWRRHVHICLSGCRCKCVVACRCPPFSTATEGTKDHWQGNDLLRESRCSSRTRGMVRCLREWVFCGQVYAQSVFFCAACCFFALSVFFFVRYLCVLFPSILGVFGIITRRDPKDFEPQKTLNPKNPKP